MKLNDIMLISVISLMTIAMHSYAGDTNMTYYEQEYQKIVYASPEEQSKLKTLASIQKAKIKAMKYGKKKVDAMKEYNDFIDENTYKVEGGLGDYFSSSDIYCARYSREYLLKQEAIAAAKRQENLQEENEKKLINEIKTMTAYQVMRSPKHRAVRVIYDAKYIDGKWTNLP